MRDTSPYRQEPHEIFGEDDFTHAPAESHKKSRRRELIVGICAAIALHFLLLALLVLIPAPPQPPMKITQVRLVPPSSMPQPAPLVEQEAAPQKQIVSTAPPKDAERPKDARYLAEHDARVQEETISTETSLTPTQLADRKREQAATSKPNSTPGGPQVKGEKSPLTAQQRRDREGVLARRQEAAPGNSQQGTTLPNNLLPNYDEVTSDSAGAPFADHVDDVEEGVHTRLNTWEWKHASFFNRIKESVAREWDPRGAIQRSDPAGALIGKQDRHTLVEVMISRSGELMSVRVQKPSGVVYLDEEALRAFRMSAPYANPPMALFGRNNTFRFQFGFALTVDQGVNIDFNWNN